MTACWGWLPPWTWSSAWGSRDACRHRQFQLPMQASGVGGDDWGQRKESRVSRRTRAAGLAASRATAWRSGARLRLIQRVHLVDGSCRQLPSVTACTVLLTSTSSSCASARGLGQSFARPSPGGVTFDSIVADPRSVEHHRVQADNRSQGEHRPPRRRTRSHQRRRVPTTAAGCG